VCVACEINLPENLQARQELRELCRITALDGVSLLVKEVETNRVVSVSFNKVQVGIIFLNITFIIHISNKITVHTTTWRGALLFKIPQ